MRRHFALLLALAALPTGPGAPAEEKDSCVDCHRNPDFLVQNQKLYDYYRDWQLSIHKQYDVSCSDCHGGNPEIADKRRAHGGDIGEEAASSAVNFRNIPDTCGQCHDDYLEAYLTSKHFEHLVEAKQEKQGPNCVTCHGSMNTDVLNVTTVKTACERCHNQETQNEPEIPDEARVILNKFLSIDRFYRYLSVRLDPEQKAVFQKDADARIHALAVTWHGFDLKRIERETRALVDLMKEKRDAVAIRSRGEARP
jgi:hypothetical protein